MWRALEQQRVLGSVKVTTGLAERASWGSFPTGIDFLTHYVSTAPKNKVNTWLVNQMRRRNQTPDLFTPDGFNAALMLVRAIGRGGGTDVDRMISALEGWQFVGPKGSTGSASRTTRCCSRCSRCGSARSTDARGPCR